MRRIIFGAIWLTGFLAVLLSWGMMWSSTQGEGAVNILGVEYGSFFPSDCQLVVVNPENGKSLGIGKPSPFCGHTSVGWSADGQWLYYSFMKAIYEGPFQLERINRDFRNSEVIIEDIQPLGGNENVLTTPSLNHLLYTHLSMDQDNHVQIDWYMSDGRGQNTRNITGQLLSPLGPVEFASIAFSPNQSAVVIEVGDDSTFTYYLCWINLDTGAIHLIPSAIHDRREMLLWTDSPQWLVWSDTPGRDDQTSIYKTRLDGSDETLLVTFDYTDPFDIWVHQSGVIGFLEGNTFVTMLVDTGEILWTLDSVQTLYTGNDKHSRSAHLDPDWVHFRMADGRFARCRVDGSDLTFYGKPNSQPISRETDWKIWDWSPDKEWVWYSIYNGKLRTGDVYRAQRDTGREQRIFNDVGFSFWDWSPDGQWAYYRDEGLGRIRADGKGQPQRIAPYIEPLTWTPPYQGEWQPTHTLIIGIGLMSFSTLTPIVLWRRRDKPRTT